MGTFVLIQKTAWELVFVTSYPSYFITTKSLPPSHVSVCFTNKAKWIELGTNKAKALYKIRSGVPKHGKRALQSMKKEPSKTTQKSFTAQFRVCLCFCIFWRLCDGIHLECSLGAGSLPPLTLAGLWSSRVGAQLREREEDSQWALTNERKWGSVASWLLSALGAKPTESAALILADLPPCYCLFSPVYCL